MSGQRSYAGLGSWRWRLGSSALDLARLDPSARGRLVRILAQDPSARKGA
ncbi:MAG: hypothetical protein ACTTIC_02630 [Helicobacteraceae bacterium]